MMVRSSRAGMTMEIALMMKVLETKMPLPPLKVTLEEDQLILQRIMTKERYLLLLRGRVRQRGIITF